MTRRTFRRTRRLLYMHPMIYLLIVHNRTAAGAVSSSNAPQTVPAGPLDSAQLNSVVQEILRNLQGRGRAGVTPGKP
jgi:hypothetical protein